MENKKSFGLIVNSNAGKVRSGSYKREFFEDIFKNQGIIRETKSLDELSRALKSFQDAGVDILFIYGGDGTHQKVISELIQSSISFPYIVPLKGGTLNMLVKDVHLGSSSIKIVRKIKRLYGTLNNKIPSFKKPILKVSYGSGEYTYGFYFANGVIYKILKRYYENPSSVANALKVTIGGLLGSFLSRHSYSSLFDPISCNVIADEKNVNENQFLGIMCSTLNRVVFGMTPFGKKPESMNQFVFTGYAFGKREFIFYFPLLAKGINLNHPKIHSLSPEKLVLKCDSGFILDGEMYDVNEPMEIAIEIGGFLNIPIISS